MMPWTKAIRLNIFGMNKILEINEDETLSARSNGRSAPTMVSRIFGNPLCRISVKKSALSNVRRQRGLPPHVAACGLEPVLLFATLAVGDGRQHLVLGCERTAEAVTERVIAVEGSTRVAGCSRDLVGGIDRQGFLGDDLLLGVVLKQRESVQSLCIGLLILLVDRRCLGEGATRVGGEGKVHRQRIRHMLTHCLQQEALPGRGLRIDSAGLDNVLHVASGVWVDIEGLGVEEVDRLVDSGFNATVRGVDEAPDEEDAVGPDRARAGYDSGGAGCQVFIYLGSWGRAEGIADQPATDLAAAVVGEDEQVRGCVKEVVGVEDADGDGVLIAVAEHAGKGSEVDAVGLEVEGLDTGNRLPEEGIDASGEDEGIDRRDPGGLAVDADLSLAEGGVAAALERAGHVVGHTKVKELIVDLVLGEDVEIDLLHVARQVDGLGELAGSGVERERIAAGADAYDDVRRDRSEGERRSRIELQRGVGKDDSVKGGVDGVADSGRAWLGGFEDRGEVGDVALNVPGGAEVAAGLGSSAEEDVDVAEIKPGGAVELVSCGDGEVCRKDDFGPWAGTSCGGSVVERGCVEVVKRRVGKQ